MGERCQPPHRNRLVTERRLQTRLVHLRGARLDPETVNPPIERASTVVFDDPDTLYSADRAYGRMGLSVHRELEAGLGLLESAEHVRLAPNGLGACALGIAALVEAGDHVLIQDSIYGPTRRFCERRLARMGVSITRFGPRIDRAALDALISETTRLIVLESPASLTFELPDTQMIAELARKRGVRTLLDNTWGAGLYHRPLDLGVDVSVQALTKYVVGHADAFGGAVMTNDSAIAAQVSACSEDWGIGLAPDDAYTALRGLRTLPTRLAAHGTAGLELADWLAAHPAVERVLHPARSDHPDHAIWQRDFSGSCGLFGIVLKEGTRLHVNDMLRRLELFAMGFSWGGFESLLIHCDPQLNRACSDHSESLSGPLLRIHVGLEAPSDLIADLKQAFTVLT